MSADWKRKLTSRKFWLAVTSFIALLIIAIGGSQETATRVTALIMAGASVFAYIIGEGLVDAAAASSKNSIVPDQPSQLQENIGNASESTK